MGVAARGRGTILVDVAAAELAAALSAGTGESADVGERMRPRTARSAPDAVDVVASLDPGVVVVAPGNPSDTADRAAAHRAIAERTRWWCEAAAVTGAFVVLVGTSDVFGAVATDAPADVGSVGAVPATVPPPDEFSHPTPVDRLGRAWRAAEAAVRMVDGAVVRRGPGSGDAVVAELVSWVVAGRRRGVWHVECAELDDLHTRVVRSAAGSTDRRTREDR